MFNTKEFLSGVRATNIVNFTKEDIINDVKPNGVQLYFLYDAWRMALVNGTTNERFAMKLLPTTATKAGIDVPKAVQDAAEALNNAAKVLAVTPDNKQAKAAITKNSPVVQAWVTETFDSEDTYVYAGKTEEGKKFVVLSPNAPGEATGIQTIAFTSELVAA